jgi:spore coat polysaccharide biosynthesis protein SpsF
MADLGGRPVIDRVVSRLRASALVEEVVIATSTAPADDALEDWARSSGTRVVRGDEFDVLDRFHSVLAEFPRAEHLVRVTGDCPLIDPALVDDVIRLHLGTGADFSANRLPPPARRTTPVGLDVEVARREALETAWRAAREPADREHVMPFLYREPGRFRVSVSDMDEDLSGYRWTVDTPEDLEAVRAIWAHLDGPLAGWAEVLAVVREHPEISELNAQVAQKHVDVVDERWRGDVG